MIVVVDSGGANLISIMSAFYRLGVEVGISSDKQQIKDASHVILPGVGSASRIMERLQALDLIELIKTLTQPVLGICVGMQILFESSEEGHVQCLGLLPGKVKQLSPTLGLSLPHMGWNTLRPLAASPLLRGIPEGAYVYFVHSFAASLSEYSLASTQYGDEFSAAVAVGNFFGVQFHPERSGGVGREILKNFLTI